MIERLLRWFRLDLDIDIDLARAPLSPITDELHLGTRPRAESVQALREAGITHVVSCLSADARPKVEFLQDSFRALFIPMEDSMHEDLAPAMSGAKTFWDEERSRTPEARLLVHCEAGVSRSASVVIALLMRARGAPFYDTFLDVRRRRPEILPNIGFASQLQRLEHELLGPSKRPLSSLARYLVEACSAPTDAQTLEHVLQQHGYDAPRALEAMFDGEIPRVVQGVRV